MSRYIDADKLKDTISIWLSDCKDETEKEAFKMFKSALRLRPTADVEEVVHCKDCKFYHADGNWCDLNSHFLDGNDEPCLVSESSSWNEFGDDDYCSKGERNEK